jgi:hypothetical protein
VKETNCNAVYQMRDCRQYHYSTALKLKRKTGAAYLESLERLQILELSKHSYVLRRSWHVTLICYTEYEQERVLPSQGMQIRVYIEKSRALDSRNRARYQERQKVVQWNSKHVILI